MEEEITILFENAVPMRLKFVDREDQHIDCTVKVEYGNRGSGSAAFLRAQLTDENNLYFLNTLELNEEEFQVLKTEQSLLVDFATFPRKFIELLTLCIESQNIDPPKYLAQLTNKGTVDSVLELIETNPFKHLVHLSLRFRGANDAGVKKYLATELQNLKTRHMSLQLEHENTKADLEEKLNFAQMKQDEAEEQNNVILNKTQQALQEAEIKFASEMAIVKEKAMEDQGATRESCEQEKKEMRSLFDSQMNDLKQRMKTCQQENSLLTDVKNDYENQIRQYENSLSSANQEQGEMSKQVLDLRKENKHLDSKYHELEKEKSRLDVEFAALKQQVEDQEQVISKMEQLNESSAEQKKSMEESMDNLKEKKDRLDAKLKQSVEEINKANSIIQQLQSDLKESRTKIKQHKASIREKEEILQRTSDKAKDNERALQSLKKENDFTQQEKEKLGNTVSDLKSKLAESQGIIESNQKVMTYLNNELTERKLGATTGPTTRFAGRTLPKTVESLGASMPTKHVPLNTATANVTTKIAWPPKTHVAARFTSFVPENRLDTSAKENQQNWKPKKEGSSGMTFSSEPTAINPLLSLKGRQEYDSIGMEDEERRGRENNENSMESAVIASLVEMQSKKVSNDVSGSGLFPSGLIPESI